MFHIIRNDTIKKYYPEKIFFSPESPTLQVNNEDSLLSNINTTIE